MKLSFSSYFYNNINLTIIRIKNILNIYYYLYIFIEKKKKNEITIKKNIKIYIINNLK